jgi:hypothetical protein
MTKKYTMKIAFQFVLAFSLSLGLLQAKAEGLAGPDQKTCNKASNLTEITPVRLGVDNPPSGVCYYWSPEEHLSNPHSANPMASPPQTTTYTLTVVGPNFAWERSYSVTVEVDYLLSYHVTPKYNCYKAGTNLTKDDFEITTNPPGMEARIDFLPKTTDLFPVPLPIGETSQTIVFTSECSAISRSVTIHVVDDRSATNFQAVLPDVGNIRITNSMEKLASTLDKLNFLRKIPLPMTCGFTSIAPQLVGGYGQTKNCCDNGNAIVTGISATGAYKICFASECQMPIPYLSIPLVMSVNAVLGWEICASPTISYETSCSDTANFCFSVPLEIELGGGVGIEALGGYLLKGSLKLVTAIAPPTPKICFNPNLTFNADGQLCGQVDVVGEVEFLSFMKKKVTHSLIPKKCVSLVF